MVSVYGVLRGGFTLWGKEIQEAAKRKQWSVKDLKTGKICVCVLILPLCEHMQVMLNCLALVLSTVSWEHLYLNTS